MNSNEVIYTYRITRKVRTGGSGCLSLFSFLAGLVFLFFILWPIGVLFLILAFVVSVKTKHVTTCGHCGNEVSHTSVLCPTCHADLAPEPIAKRWWRSF